MPEAQGIGFPTHAYVPGRTDRHPEGAFSALRGTVRDGDGPVQLAASAAWRHGLVWLQAGYFWEAHEMFEPVWMALPPDSAERRFVQALIQVANARLKLAMARPSAALRLVGLARDLLSQCMTPDVERVMGCDLNVVLARLAQIEQQANLALGTRADP